MPITLLTLLVVAAQTPLIEQGRTLFEKGDYEHAAEMFEKAVAAMPKNAEAHYLLGATYGQMAMKASIFSQMSLASKTKTQFDEAVRLDPNHLDARWALMEYYMMAPALMGGSEAKAIDEANEIRKRDAQRGHYAWAYIYGQQKKPELVHKEYVDAVREQPGSPKAHVSLAALYISEKNYAGATTEVDTAAKLDPNYMPVWFWTGRLAVASGANYAAGEAALRKYLGYTPKRDEPGLHRAHFWLGQIFEKTGRKAEAKASYEASLRLKPNQKDVTEALKRVS